MRTNLASVLPFVLVTVGLVGCTCREKFVVASAVDTTVRIVAASSAAASYQREIEAEREERAEAEGRRAYAEAAEAAAVENPKRRCTEVRVLVVPPPPPGTPALRGMDCNGRVLVQDAEGKWRDYDAALPSAAAPAPASAPELATAPAQDAP